MHGLVNRAIQAFLCGTYGPELWHEVAADIGIGPEGFETMQSYPDALTADMLAAAERHLRKRRAAILEDLGIYLVSIEPVRRLLRFGGADFPEFLLSLEELEGRAHLAVPDLRLPAIAVDMAGPQSFDLRVTGQDGFGHVLTGMLRAMADDYGALALIDLVPGAAGVDRLTVHLVDPGHAAGRVFHLARPAAA